MLITHDIESALTIADKIAVFYGGTTVEIAPVDNFAGKGEALRHPYSKALWRALPQNEFIPIPGSQPHPSALPQDVYLSHVVKKPLINVEKRNQKCVNFGMDW